MLHTTLLVIALATSLVMVVLLALPQNDPPTPRDRLPALGAAVVLLLTLLAIIGGLAVAA